DGDGPMVVHLLRELPRQLDGLHVRAEGAPEDAFEECLDLLLDCPEDHECGRTLPPRGSHATRSARTIKTAVVSQAAAMSGRACADGTASTVMAIMAAPSAAAPQRPRACAYGRTTAVAAKARASIRSPGCAPATRMSEPATSSGPVDPATPMPSGGRASVNGSAAPRTPATTDAATTATAA